MAGDDFGETGGNAAHGLRDIGDITGNGINRNIGIGLDIVTGDGRPGSVA